MLQLIPLLLGLLLYSTQSMPVDPSQTIVQPSQTVPVTIASPTLMLIRPILPDNSDYIKDFHISIAAAVMVLLLITYGNFWYSGFKLSRSFSKGTDTLVWGLLGIGTMLWLIFLFVEGWKFGNRPCNSGSKWLCFSHLAYGPWVLNSVFLVWVVWNFYVYFVMPDPTRDVPWDDTKWRFGLRRRIVPVASFFLAAAPIILTSVGAFHEKQYLIVTLNVTALFLLPISLLATSDYNLGTGSSSIYDATNIRIPLVTSPSLDHGVVYILPYRGKVNCFHKELGFDAASTRILKNSRQVLRENMGFIEHPLELGWDLKSCRSAIWKIVHAHNLRVQRITDDQLENLAEWLYWTEDCGWEKMPNKLRCKQLNGVNLVGRELAMALLHWESLVFTLRSRLPPHLKEKVWKYRDRRYSGTQEDWETYSIEQRGYCCGKYVNCKCRNGRLSVVGGVRGFQGLLEAASHVHAIFSAGPVDEHDFQVNGPETSVAFTQVDEGKSAKEYAGDLWDECYKTEPSTFGALYLWTVVWYLDMGNTPHFHIAPFQPVQNCGDVTSWLIDWRHAWVTAFVTQLIVMLPTISGSLLSAMISD